MENSQPTRYVGIDVMRYVSAIWVFIFHIDPMRPLAWVYSLRGMFKGINFVDATKYLFSRDVNNQAQLDVLRCIALLLVFGQHLARHSLPPAFLAKYFDWGGCGVDLFFCLSGYLIGKQLWEETRKTGSINIIRFILRRGLRIWPLYFSVMAYVVVKCIICHASLSGVIFNAIFLSNYSQNGVVGGAWSLATEEQFYILAPILICLYRKWVSVDNLWILPLIAVMLTVSSKLIFHFAMLANIPSLLFLGACGVYTPIHMHSEGLSIGLLIAWFAVFYPSLMRSRVFVGSVSLFLCVTAYVLFAISKDIFIYTSTSAVWGGVMLLALSAAKISKVLRWNGFYVFSRLTYGVYLNHFGAVKNIPAVLKKFLLLNGPVLFWINYVLILAVCVAVSMITYYVVEWPFLLLRRRLFKSV